MLKGVSFQTLAELEAAHPLEINVVSDVVGLKLLVAKSGSKRFLLSETARTSLKEKALALATLPPDLAPQNPPQNC